MVKGGWVQVCVALQAGVRVAPPAAELLLPGAPPARAPQSSWSQVDARGGPGRGGSSGFPPPPRAPWRLQAADGRQPVARRARWRRQRLRRKRRAAVGRSCSKRRSVTGSGGGGGGGGRGTTPASPAAASSTLWALPPWPPPTAKPMPARRAQAAAAARPGAASPLVTTQALRSMAPRAHVWPQRKKRGSGVGKPQPPASKGPAAWRRRLAAALISLAACACSHASARRSQVAACAGQQAWAGHAKAFCARSGGGKEAHGTDVRRQGGVVDGGSASCAASGMQRRRCSKPCNAAGGL